MLRDISQTDLELNTARLRQRREQSLLLEKDPLQPNQLQLLQGSILQRRPHRSRLDERHAGLGDSRVALILNGSQATCETASKI